MGGDREMPDASKFEAIEKELFNFPASSFVKRSVNEIGEQMERFRAPFLPP
jgi:hypothetical protein